MENDEQLRFLRNAHCDEVQGFEIGRPMPAAEAKAFLRARSVPKRSAA